MQVVTLTSAARVGEVILPAEAHADVSCKCIVVVELRVAQRVVVVLPALEEC